MKLELELTPEVEEWARRMSRPGAVEFRAAVTVAKAILAALPSEPRDMPPGKELDRLVDTAVGMDYQGHWWSRNPSTIGFMLDWLHEHGHDPLISYTAWRGSWHVTLGGARHFYGDTPAHALAQAIATIGGTK